MKGIRAKDEYVSVFVNNLPKGMHWRWLKQLFEYHGKVIDAFILNKRNIKGKRIGFVRYANINDANKAINRMGILASKVAYRCQFGKI
ncbi:hypothetical protein Godav_005720 [Gossypium davidsonii]|uniref:RRM domain-containing protein n=2 Tax=Gossypium TaxID=3633 RepID=A0A7J8S266_GOSDV|nr:hypothetical protein [Gossypium davidsonii]MBA0655322.1 hypothetical protein [Gossypium klotzschianum]